MSLQNEYLQPSLSTEALPVSDRLPFMSWEIQSETILKNVCEIYITLINFHTDNLISKMSRTKFFSTHLSPFGTEEKKNEKSA